MLKLNNISTVSQNDILQFMLDRGKISLDDVLEDMEEMNKKKILEQHPYKITQYSDGRWKTYLPDPENPHGRRQIAKKSREDIENAIYENAKAMDEKSRLSGMTMTRLFENWMIWRRENGTDPKTIKENDNEWKRFLADHELARKKVVRVEPDDLESFFLDITKGHAITMKRLTNVKSVLNGMFRRAVSLKIIDFNPMSSVDFSQFKTRCKPSGSSKDNYSTNERKAILEYLKDDEDIYSLAISLAFHLCVRIGELLAIRKEDIAKDRIYICRSVRRNQSMKDDLTFDGINYTVERRIKGNQTEGFRFIPLTSEATDIIRKITKVNPDGEYLFMRKGKMLLGDTFNERLKKICNHLGIKYRSSHQIRFTTSTMLYEAGMDITHLSTLLGHSDTRTTFHYIRQQQADAKTFELMNHVLN